MGKDAELADSAGFFSTGPGRSIFSLSLKNKDLSIMVLRSNG